MTAPRQPAPRLTPMFEQYLRIKGEHPGALLFYRMGDFYEMFFEDAETAARELSLTLTARAAGGENKAPMCGVPHHSADGYLTQLLEKGYTVAICDQVEDPKAAKGLVRREVTRVLTPGTLVEDLSLKAKESNWLAALFWDDAREAGGLAWADVSTGEWSGLQSRSAETLWQWLAKLQPRELLLPAEAALPKAVADMGLAPARLPLKPAWDPAQAARAVLTAQGAPSLDMLDLADKPELIRACGALVAYLTQTQRQEPAHLRPFRPLDPSRHLLIDELTERNLELFRRMDGRAGKGTLLAVIDRTATPMGGRLLADRLRRPWRTAEPIERSLDAVAFLLADDGQRHELRARLEQVRDLERLTTRIAVGRAMPKDLAALRESLAALPGIFGLLAGVGKAQLPADLAADLASWEGIGAPLAQAGALLASALVDCPPPTPTEGGLFRQGHDAELDELIELADHGEARLQELLERERRDHNLPRLKLGFNRVFGYYLELSSAHKGDVPFHFSRRQTTANGERYVTPQLKELEDKLLTAADRRRAVEHRLFRELCATLAGHRHGLMGAGAMLARLDVCQSLAECARLGGWARPTVSADMRLSIRAARHPVVEAAQGGGNFVPSDVHLDEAARMLLITGPNMAGKSTVLRQTALICILAQMGGYVPAAAAHVGLVDRVFSRVGASDNLAMGQSTFMVEMMETARILRLAGRRSLVILDEIGRGTSTFDGLALAWAVVEELARRGGGIRTLFATHYHELTALEGRIHGLRNYTMAIKEWKGEVIFLRRLIPGPSDRSYGIEVARLAGVPQPVVARAREILAELERARDEHGGPRLPVSQGLLPGMSRPTPAPEPAPPAVEHPLLAELRALAVDQLTPLAALTLLHDYKARLLAEDGDA